MTLNVRVSLLVGMFVTFLKVNSGIDTSNSVLKVLSYSLGGTIVTFGEIRKEQFPSCQKPKKEFQTDSYQGPTGGAGLRLPSSFPT